MSIYASYCKIQFAEIVLIVLIANMKPRRREDVLEVNNEL